MEEFLNRFVKTVYVEAKYSLISKGYPLDIDEEKLKELNYDSFKISLIESIENLSVEDYDLRMLKKVLKEKSKKLNSKSKK